MPRLNKDALLGANDLAEKEVELETIGGSVVVRALPAKFSNDAQSQAMKLTNVGREQIASVDKAKLEAIQILHGLVDPKLDSLEEAEGFMERCGPAVGAVVEAIDELSELDKKAILEAKARFPGGSESESGPDLGDGSPNGSSGPDIPARTGA